MSNERSSRPSASTTIGTSMLIVRSFAVGCNQSVARQHRNSEVAHGGHARDRARVAGRGGLGGADRAERLEEWFAHDVELDLEPGGEGVFRWDDGDERHAVVEEVEPERRFAFTWGDSRVCIELDAVEDGTRVLVTETLGAGWGTALAIQALAVCV